MKCYVLDHANLWIGDGTAYQGHLVIVDRLIEKVGRGRYEGPLPVTNLSGASISPGLIDLMVLGGFDISICRDDPMDIAREYVRLGVTSFQASFGCRQWDGMDGVVNNIRSAKAYSGCDASQFIGLYPEGPFQQSNLTGGSLGVNSLPATSKNVERVLDEFGDVITMINIAPGIEGDTEAIRSFCQSGKVVSMAHSNAPIERVIPCIEAGTSVLGHIWDNMPFFGSNLIQEPSIEQAALTDERVKWIHMISDGVHVHPVMMQIVLRCRGIESLCLVTDCGIKSGRPDGPYLSDDNRNFYSEDGVCRTNEGHLAGSATLLPDAFRNFVKFTKIDPQIAIQSVTSNPAKSLGLETQIGLLSAGSVADLVVWDNNLRVSRVWRNGEELDNVSEYATVTM